MIGSKAVDVTKTISRIGPLGPARTVFWVGAGASIDAPSCLPSGKALTEAYLQCALGREIAQRLGSCWNSVARAKRLWNVLARGVDSGKQDPSIRLEFIIGEIDKIDRAFLGIEHELVGDCRKYRRAAPVIAALAQCASAPANANHRWLADYLKAGSQIVTTNFDTCIEKAASAVIGEGREGACHGVPAVVFPGNRTVHHLHGIASEKGSQQNLGATLASVRKSIPSEFREWFTEMLREGATIVFVGYSGSDYFDVQPFFEEMQEAAYSGTAIVHNYSGGELVDGQRALVRPFSQRLQTSGPPCRLFEALWLHMGLSPDDSFALRDAGAGSGSADADDGDPDRWREPFLAIEREYRANGNYDAFVLVNAIRIASQLTIHPDILIPKWDERAIGFMDDFAVGTAGSELLNDLNASLGTFTRVIVPDLGNGYMAVGASPALRSRLRLVRSIDAGAEYEPYAYEKAVRHLDEAKSFLAKPDWDGPGSEDIVAVTRLVLDSVLRESKEAISEAREPVGADARFGEMRQLLSSIASFPYSNFPYISYYLEIYGRYDWAEYVASNRAGRKRKEEDADLERLLTIAFEIPSLMFVQRVFRNKQRLYGRSPRGAKHAFFHLLFDYSNYSLLNTLRRAAISASVVLGAVRRISFV